MLLLAGFDACLVAYAAIGGAASIRAEVVAVVVVSVLVVAGQVVGDVRPAWMIGGQRERAVVDGTWDRDDPAARRYVARLTSARSLSGLARGLRGAVAEREPPFASYRVWISGAAVGDQAACAACLALADTLEATSAPDPTGVVRVVRLLRDPHSPLAGTNGKRLAEDATALRLQFVLGDGSLATTQMLRAGAATEVRAPSHDRPRRRTSRRSLP